MITIVSGAPCSGKSTYVRERAGLDDVVVDFDLLAQAVGSSHPHHHGPAHVRVARQMRRDAIDMVANHPALYADAWIVDTAPSHSVLAYYVAAGARFEVCDPGRDECIRRALADNRPDWTIPEIHRWYDTHTQESA
ncbi:hypothetical protein RCF27_08215 [Rhodococcus pyridinivorans]|uniref:hypothetical protein n=1 Tax=Rhodococcus pyridinivorans TaxID=103816 RepID=UPI00280B4574|nr:hypothetical protein [Rhodococcus pyridinivorans]WMM74262.1 hypothetical protein RCF27_08215 [Rhodococcus pyridinivorans]